MVLPVLVGEDSLRVRHWLSCARRRVPKNEPKPAGGQAAGQPGPNATAGGSQPPNEEHSKPKKRGVLHPDLATVWPWLLNQSKKAERGHPVGTLPMAGNRRRVSTPGMLKPNKQAGTAMRSMVGPGRKGAGTNWRGRCQRDWSGMPGQSPKQYPGPVSTPLRGSAPHTGRLVFQD